MLTVLTWFWSQPGGRATYTAEHVNIWAAMVRRHLSMPHRLACVTDQPAGIDPRVQIIEPPTDFADVRIPTWGPDRPQCLRRIAMFRADAGKLFGDRFVCMDLDCVVAGPLDPLFKGTAPFRIFRGTMPGRPYNGSMMMLTAGARRQVYDDFTPEGAAAAGQRWTGSDQAWITHALGPGEATWGPADGVTWWKAIREGGQQPTRLMFYPGDPKPWQIVDRELEPWTVEHYRGDAHGVRALILGHGPTVWSDLERALQGAFDVVIASPEAAEHWPGELLAVARDDAHADRIVRMHGFRNVTRCGRVEQVAA